MFQHKAKRKSYSAKTTVELMIPVNANSTGLLKFSNHNYLLNHHSGNPLDSETMRQMNSRFNFNFSNVRIHDNTSSWVSADSLNAKAYTLDNHIGFGYGQYRPSTREGKELLAHELTHVVQNTRSGHTTNTEEQADAAMHKVTEGKYISPEFVGGSSTKFHLKEKDKIAEDKPSKGGEEEVKIPPDKLFKAPEKEKKEGEKGPEMPSRIPIPGLNKGKFSLGLRLGFPELELGDPLRLGTPDALKESLNRAKILNQMLTGKVPSGWEDVDKGKLAKAIWGIFSENIAPGLAKKITSGLSTSTTPGGPSYELDLVLITDFSKEIGGGLSLTVRF